MQELILDAEDTWIRLEGLAEITEYTVNLQAARGLDTSAVVSTTFITGTHTCTHTDTSFYFSLWEDHYRHNTFPDPKLNHPYLNPILTWSQVLTLKKPFDVVKHPKWLRIAKNVFTFQGKWVFGFSICTEIQGHTVSNVFRALNLPKAF